MNPKVSIIIPVYNVEAYLKQCMDSVVKQTYRNLEIICVDDGATDGSLNILESYSAMDNRVKVISKKNGGLSSARNIGNQHVTGKYIMYVDSDDWIELDTCEVAVQKAEELDADVVFWSYIREFSECSKEKNIYDADEIIFSEQEDLRKLHRRFLGLYGEELRHPENADSIVTVWGKLYRASIIIDNKIYFVDTKEIGTEDALFNLYAFGNVKKAVYIRNYFNHYRKNNNASLTNTYKNSLPTQWKKLFGYMREYIKDNEYDISFCVALNNRIALSIIGLGLNILDADSTINKVMAVKDILADAEYRKAVKQLELKHFSIHWWLFFFFARCNFAFGVYLLLVCIKKMIGG